LNNVDFMRQPDQLWRPAKSNVRKKIKRNQDAQTPKLGVSRREQLK